MSTIANDNLQFDNSNLSGLSREDAIVLINLEAVLKNYRDDDLSRDALSYEIDIVMQSGFIDRVIPEVLGNFLKAEDVAYGLVEFLKYLPIPYAVAVKNYVVDTILINDGPRQYITASREVVLGRIGLLTMWFDCSQKCILQLAVTSNLIASPGGWDTVSPCDLANLMRGAWFDQGRVFAFSHLPAQLFPKTTILAQSHAVCDQIDRITPRLNSPDLPSADEFELVFPGASETARTGILTNDMTAYEYLHSMTCMGEWDLMYQKHPEAWITVRFCDVQRSFVINEVVEVENKWSDGIKALVLVRRSLIRDEIAKLCENDDI